MQESTAYHCHSAGDGCGASTAPHAISRGAFWSPGTTHGTLPAGMLGGVSNATIRRHPSFDLFHTQNSAAKRKKRVMYLQTHRLRAKYVNSESSVRPAQSPLVLLLLFSCHGILNCWKVPCKQPQRPKPVYLQAAAARPLLTVDESHFCPCVDPCAGWAYGPLQLWSL